jgi:2,3-bisphosphoglycerate-dependent phosphoglycerate mutase
VNLAPALNIVSPERRYDRMALGLAVGDDHWTVGSPDLLHAFFSTVSVRLEPDGWGSRFPALMHGLYYGELPVTAVETALSELLLVRRELGLYGPRDVVWDADDLTVAAPWGEAVASGALNLAHCFFTAVRIVDRLAA